MLYALKDLLLFLLIKFEIIEESTPPDNKEEHLRQKLIYNLQKKPTSSFNLSM